MIRIQAGFLLRDIEGSAVVVAVGEKVAAFNAMLKLSESGALLFSLLQAGASREALVEAITARYVVDEQTAKRDVDAFVDRLLALDVAETV